MFSSSLVLDEMTCKNFVGAAMVSLRWWWVSVALKIGNWRAGVGGHSEKAGSRDSGGMVVVVVVVEK